MENKDLTLSKKRIITATGQTYMDTIISKFNDFEVVDTVDYKEDLYKACLKEKPDILIVSDFIGGKISLFKTLIKIRTNINTVRIVYLAGKVDMADTIRINGLNMLIGAGIYDIITEEIMDVELIKFVLKNPRGSENVDYIESKNIESIYGDRRQKSLIEITYRKEEEIDTSVYQNLITFISTKGGTGKTFLLSNIAVAISQLGLNNLNGNKPKVAIIDLDIAGFNISNTFETNDKEKNLIEAVKQTQRIINSDGFIIDNKGLQNDVIDSIKKMFIPSKKYSNIKVLGGPDRRYFESDSLSIRQNDIVFIIEAIIDDYDLILVDMNSDVEYAKFYPLFSMSKDIFLVMEMTFNCFNNNNRIMEHISELLGNQKIKHILNKEIENNDLVISSDDFDKYLEYNFIAKIPAINPEILFNDEYKKEFIINNPSKDLLKIRYEIIKIANNVWPIRNFEKLAEKMNLIFNKEEEIKKVNDDNNENKIIGFIKKSIGLEKKDEDFIREALKNNKVVNNIGLKKSIDKLKSGMKEIINDTNKKTKIITDENYESEDENKKEA